MDYPQAIVSIVVFSICLLLGLPVWWNTTKVYRAHLPHQRIVSAQNMPIKLTINVDILFNESVMDHDQEFVNTLSNNKHVSAGIYQFEFNFTSHKISMEHEDTSLKYYCKKLESVHERRKSLNYRFYILHNSSPRNSCYYCENMLDTIVVINNFNGTVIANQIISLMKLYTDIKEVSSNVHSQNVFKPAKHNLNMPPAVSYSIVLTLAVANPSDYMPSWNIQDAIDRYLYPLLLKLEFLGPIKVSSQVIYFVDFKEKPYKVGDIFYYPQTRLTLLMNEIQPRLQTYTSTDATLHFIVYIPPAKFVPLYIKSEKSESSYSAFHSARWGGLQLFNPNKTDHTAKVEVPIDNLIKKFVLQFGELFGLSDSEYLNIFPENQVKEISEWSVTRLLISKTLEYLSKCLNTLLSLYKLLGEIENIVISEEIRYLIESSLENYEQSVQFLAKGIVNDAIKHAKNAFEFSEKAFYDASLLALLYFPDDQKYAIYVPLFLPVTFPILASVYRSFHWWRK